MKEKLKLDELIMGNQYADTVTGFTGKLIATATFMDSGDHAYLQPVVGSDGNGGNGKMPDAQWISLNRLQDA